MLFTPAEALDRADRPSATESDPFPALLRHILSYKYYIILAAVLGSFLTGIVLCFVAPVYESQAILIVDSRRNKLADAEGALSSIVVDQYQTSLKSELELVLSTDVARHVITSLHLLDTQEYASARRHVAMAARFAVFRGELVRAVEGVLAKAGMGRSPSNDTPAQGSAPDPASVSDAEAVENAIELFRKRFTAKNDPKSLTIRISYRSEEPVIAAAVINAALQAYLDADEATKAAAVERSQAWLKGRITALRADLDVAEQAVEGFRAKHDLVTDRDRSPLQRQLLQLAGNRVDAEAALAAARSKVGRDGIPGRGTVVSSTDALSSRLVQGLRQQEAVLIAEQARLGTYLSPSNPGLVRLNEQLSGIQASLAGEINRIGQSQANDVKLAQSRLAALDGQVDALQARIADANTYDIKLRSLEADAAAKRSVLDIFTKRFDQNAGNPLTPPDGRVVSWADVPVDAASPRYGLVLVGGTLAFTALGFCLSLLLERLRSGFNSMAELSHELGLTVAGLTSAQRVWSAKRRRTRPAGDPAAINDLALTVRAIAHTPATASQGRVLLVTSALPGEGKSSTALSLARSIASSGKRCLLIDADIRKPTLSAMLQVPAMPGLVELTLDGASLSAVMRRPPGEGFDLLTSGRPAKDTLGPFISDAFSRLLAALRNQYDVIVIDSAPVLLAAEGLVLSSGADITVMLVKWRTTPRRVARRAVQLLNSYSAGPCLVVLSQVNLRHQAANVDELVKARYRTAYFPS